jgi:LysM repeat protein
MRIDASRRIQLGTWLSMLTLAFALSGCFQNAGEAIAPTPVGLTAIATLRAETPTPFVTPLSTGGFIPPTDDLSITPTTLPPANEPSQAAPTETGLPAPSETPDSFVPTTDPNQLQAQPTVPPAPTDSSMAVVPPTTEPTTAPITAPTTAPDVLATPTALPTEGPCVHTVQPGEWLNKIARQYNISLEDLEAANPSFAGRYDNLQPGDVLNIPNCNKPPAPANPTPVPANLAEQPAATTLPGVAPTPIPLSGRTYSVAAGDTLGSIARKFGTNVQALKEANGLTSDALSIGQILKIPKAE